MKQVFAILLVAFASVALLSVQVYAQPNIECERCVAIEFSVIPGEGPEYFTSDYFHYNITLTNIGPETINSITFTIKIVDSEGEVYGDVLHYKRSLAVDGITVLYPNQTADNSRYAIWSLDTIGVYKISVESDRPLTFYRIFEGDRFTFYSNKVEFPFDVISKSQRDLMNQQRDLMARQIELEENQFQVQKTATELNIRSLQIEDDLRWLAFFSYLLSGIIGGAVIFSSAKQYRKTREMEDITLKPFLFAVPEGKRFYVENGGLGHAVVGEVKCTTSKGSYNYFFDAIYPRDKILFPRNGDPELEVGDNKQIKVQIRCHDIREKVHSFEYELRLEDNG